MLMSNCYDIILLYNNNGVLWSTIIGSFEFPGDGPYRTQSSSCNQIRSNSAWARELVAWILVVILAILVIVSLAINGIQAIGTHRIWRNNKNDTSPECALVMDGNPCYKASNVKPTEAQEAVHVYETDVVQLSLAEV